MKLKMKLFLIPFCIFVLSCSQLENVSPFFSMKWESEVLQVLVNNEWFSLVEVNNTPFSKICIDLKSKSYSWKDDLHEEFQATLLNYGLTIGSDIKVKLKDKSGNIREKEVELSKANWRNNVIEVHSYPVKENTTPSNTAIYDFLKAEPLKESSSVTSSKSSLSSSFSKEEALSYIDRLQGIIENNFSYLSKFDGNYLEALSTLRSSIGKSIYVADLESKVSKFIALFGDGHAGYLASSARFNNKFLPFLIKKTTEGIIAFSKERNSLLEKDYPVITKIDDVDISKWIEKAKLYTAKGSNQYVASNTLRKLREINQFRLELNLPLNNKIRVELSSLDKTRNKTIELDLADEKPQYGAGYEKESQILENNIGYIRIKKMEKFSDDVINAMAKMKNTAGLIIDVRGNGGGNRKILIDLMPYFLENGEFYISNLAKYCIKPMDERNVSEGYLDDRFLYPISSKRFNDEEKQKLTSFIQKYKPEWNTPAFGFSDWHFMVHRKSDNSQSYHYTNKVVVLMDSDCFSATDIFLNAFKGRKSTTLIGTPSSGGSGRSFMYFFKGEPMNIINLSTMVSYKTNGELIEGKGVAPDIYFEESLTDFIGETDFMLEEAMEVIQNKSK